MSLPTACLRLDEEHSLRQVRTGDGAALARAYLRNRAHLAPWEPSRSAEFFTEDWQEAHARQCESDAVAGRSVRFIVVGDDDEIHGCVNVNNIVRGAFWSADLGYWIDSGRLHRGLASRAVDRVIGYAGSELNLHRLQAATLVHNVASQRALLGNGFERIGLASAYLKIAGEWQDHVLFQRILLAAVT